MATINPATVTDGETIDASDLNNPIATIADEINGNLDADNLADNAVSTAKIASGAVTNAKLSTSAGEIGGVWQDWTPTWTNITVGNGADNSKYMQIGKLVIAEAILDFGSTTSVAGNVTLTNFPVVANTRYASDNLTVIGEGNIFESGVGFYPSKLIMQGSSTVGVVRFNEATGATAQIESQIVTNTQNKPFSDASGAGGANDGIYIRLMYEAA